MPRRAPIGNRDAIEISLTPAQRGALVEACRAIRIPRSDWQRIDHLNRFFSTLAVANLAAAIVVRDRIAEKAALQRAVVELELTESAAAVTAKWRREWKRERSANAIKDPTSGADRLILTASQIVTSDED